MHQLNRLISEFCPDNIKAFTHAVESYFLRDGKMVRISHLGPADNGQHRFMLDFANKHDAMNTYSQLGSATCILFGYNALILRVGA